MNAARSKDLAVIFLKETATFMPKEFESDSHMKNWLIRVTVNQCKMLFRSPRNHMEDIEDYVETLGFEDKSYLDLFCAVMKHT